jgi:hypothetical protein
MVRVNKGVNIAPRIQSTSLGANFIPWGQFNPYRPTSTKGQAHLVKNRPLKFRNKFRFVGDFCGRTMKNNFRKMQSEAVPGCRKSKQRMQQPKSFIFEIMLS